MPDLQPPALSPRAPAPNQPPPHRRTAFPPEILTHIISDVSDSLDHDRRSGRDYDVTIALRNAGLVPLALVSRAFQEATYSVLYGDLRLAWMADKLQKLRNSFSHNPALAPLVRRLEATPVSESEWVLRRKGEMMRDAKQKKEWRKEYKRQNRVEGTWSARQSAVDDAWDVHSLDGARKKWTDAGHGNWTGTGNSQGNFELLDVLGELPALRSLVVQRFHGGTRKEDFDRRGPYPPLTSLHSLETPDACPFTANSTLASILLSWAPNLRSLSGSAEGGAESVGSVPTTTVPHSLSHLSISEYDHARPDIAEFLGKAEPTLRSLALQFDYTREGWASSPTLAACLSSLETLVLEEATLGEHDLRVLALALSSSTSLRHLEITLGWPWAQGMSTLLAALPPTLQSISFTPHSMYTLVPTRRIEASTAIEMVLDSLKEAAPRPLRVGFAVQFSGPAATQVAIEKWKPLYEAEGLILL